jgi:hypothetical protein
LLALFSCTIFLSAFLLFWVQLMVAKMILPLLGGSPSVWNTCMFFFQAVLLLGYGYAHLTTRWLGVRQQARIHSGLIVLPLAFLPIAFDRIGFELDTTHPIAGLLLLLLVSVGFPFLTISTSAPLVQKWFSDTDRPESSDPYFLYAASNAGSLCGVLSYPIAIEPNLSLTQQSILWAIAYAIWVVLSVCCIVYLKRSKRKRFSPTIQESPNSKHPNFRQKMQWVLLSFLPSSLLLGATTHITIDIAAIPLLWAVPLSLYLLTFILAFARKAILPHHLLLFILPFFVAPTIVFSISKPMLPTWLLLSIHLVSFFIAACTLHGELAKSRPHPDYLTGFYFWISVGGVLGGWFNSIAAPLLFSTVLEYPLVLGLSLLLLQPTANLSDRQSTQQDFDKIDQLYENLKQAKKTAPEIDISETIATTLLPEYSSHKIQPSWGKSLLYLILLGIVLGWLTFGLQFHVSNSKFLGFLLACVLFVALAYAFKLPPWRCLVGAALVILLNQFYIPMGNRLYVDRSFFGVNQVLSRENFHLFVHGTTLHGKQSLNPESSGEPLTYFARTGPVGQFFQAANTRTGTKKIEHVGVMGLGIGTMAAYIQPGQTWTFYEIDPMVKDIASNPDYFTFLQTANEATKSTVSVVVGDGRQSIAQKPDRYYDLIVMDAFSSDAIPVHLVTREAVDLYLQKLSPHGLLAFNITNRYIDLEPVIHALAENRGLLTLHWWEKQVSAEERAQGKTASHWVVLARDRSDFGTLLDRSHWQPISDNRSVPVWTDDFSNIFSVLRTFGRKD